MSAPTIDLKFKSGSSAYAGESVALFQHWSDVPPSNICDVLPFRPQPRTQLEWLTTVYSCVSRGEIDEALETAFDALVDLQSEGRFPECDEVLGLIDVGGLDSNLMVGILSATYRAKDKLRNRAKLLRRIEHRLREIAPERVEALIGGLR